VVISSLRPADQVRTVVGARFVALDGANRARIEHILSGVRSPADVQTPLQMGELRELVAEPEPEPGGWRRMFRRSS
jgi:hypothetical protein